MSGVVVTDHALVRFLDRAGGLDVEELRDALSASLTRSVAAARMIGAEKYAIHADGLVYVIVENRVATIYLDRKQ